LAAKGPIALEVLKSGKDGSPRVVALLKHVDASFNPRISATKDLTHYGEKLAGFAEVIIASDVSEDAGFIAFYANDANQLRAYISILGVRSEYAGMGIATMLIKAALDRAGEMGMKSIALHSNRKNVKAVSLYRKCGFAECDGELHNQSGKVLMCKSI
jgi:ribosomal protein S18 acetylase RimI-like enzyme